MQFQEVGPQIPPGVVNGGGRDSRRCIQSLGSRDGVYEPSDQRCHGGGFSGTTRVSNSPGCLHPVAVTGRATQVAATNRVPTP